MVHLKTIEEKFSSPRTYRTQAGEVVGGPLPLFYSFENDAQRD